MQAELTFEYVFFKKGGNKVSNILIKHKSNGISSQFAIPLEFCCSPLPCLTDLEKVLKMLKDGDNFDGDVFTHKFYGGNNMSALQLFKGHMSIYYYDDGDCETSTLNVSLDGGHRDFVIELFTELVKYKNYQEKLHQAIEKHESSEKLQLELIDNNYHLFMDEDYVVFNFETLTPQEYDEIFDFGTVGHKELSSGFSSFVRGDLNIYWIMYKGQFVLSTANKEHLKQLKEILLDLVVDDKEIMNIILEYSKETNMWNEYLYMASAQSNISAMKYFIRKGANDFHYALQGAENAKQKEAIEFLNKQIEDEIPPLVDEEDFYVINKTVNDYLTNNYPNRMNSNVLEVD